MPTRFSAAITRTATARRPAVDRGERLSRSGRSSAVPETRARVPGRSVSSVRAASARSIWRGGSADPTLVPDVVCIKVSRHIDGWLREAYFGRLLDGHPRAIRVFDAFPLMASDRAVLYCLALEYARHGDLSAFLRRDDRQWTEAATRREIAGILEVLGKLHRGQTAAPRPDAAQRLRLRQPPPQARRLRHRPAAERPARDHGPHDERA